MPEITLVQPDGSAQRLQAPAGVSLMQAACAAGIDGIVAECGGSAVCATCHVIVDPAWAGLLPPPLAVESEMLEFTAAPREANSRLACQIMLSAALHGLVVRLPVSQ